MPVFTYFRKGRVICVYCGQSFRVSKIQKALRIKMTFLHLCEALKHCFVELCDVKRIKMTETMNVTL